MAALPPHMPVPSHARHGSTSSLSSISQFQPPPPSLAPQVNPVNSTRILLLSQFSPALKTKDLIDLVQGYVDPAPPTPSTPGTPPFKLKWRDDTSCFVVFHDPLTAKRTFLRLISSPPAPLSPRETGTYAPCIHAYTGDDAQQIIHAVQNKQRTRSIAGQGAVSGSAVMGHQRRSSQAGSQGGGGPSSAGSSLPPIATGAGNPSSAAAAASSSAAAAGAHHRSGSWARRTTQSANTSATSPSSPPSSRLASSSGPGQAGRASPSTGAATGSGPDAMNGWRTASPDQPGGASGIVAGEAPRRFGTATNGASGF
ncbi:hypothetical protein BMF94_3367 [Rhodotorula taiwanensis]|uniref:Uncharacterized protein n=1 Tax=Rhodotorula taiwanensis TaxID=741276 RepID=A0A2S5BAM7_9BASI|nr:hypothetical protein BMF94_3367 [Rhodotorula taiwanensis]